MGQPSDVERHVECCEHLFRRFRRWPVKIRWRCDKCGYTTRHYDSTDRMMTRPIHGHMSVAFKGFNTVED